MKKLAAALFFVLVSFTAFADGGWLDQGGGIYGSGGVYSPGFVSFSGSTGFQGFSVTSQGVSQTFGNFSVGGSSFVPQGADGGFASAYGSVVGGSFASHSAQFGNFNSSWMSSNASASAVNGGNTNMNVNGSTSSQSFTFQPPAPVSQPTSGGGKG